MIRELKESFGLEPIFVVDSGVLDYYSKNNFFQYLFRNSDGLNHLTDEFVDNELGRLVEIQFLLANSETLVVSEVRDEIRDYELRLRKALKYNATCSSGEFLEKNMRVQRLGELTAGVAETRRHLFERDPRENGSRYNRDMRFDKNDPIYQKILQEASSKMVDIHQRRKKTKKWENPVTDANIFSVAYFLKNKGYDTCILSKDIDLLCLAKDFKLGTNILHIPDFDGGGRIVRAPTDNYEIKLFLPEIIRYDFSRF